MDASRWTDHIESIAVGLRRMVVTDDRGGEIPTADGFAQWVALTRTTAERDGQIYIVGNGGSAAMASNIATDAMKNACLRAVAFNDVALLTATANDLSYDQVFALPFERLARADDLLISISCSGNSPSIVRALDAARARGVPAVTVSGMTADNQSRSRGTLNFYVPLSHYGWAESAHQAILHYWIDLYVSSNPPRS